jgi:hypothetical protein
VSRSWWSGRAKERNVTCCWTSNAGSQHDDATEQVTGCVTVCVISESCDRIDQSARSTLHWCIDRCR